MATRAVDAGYRIFERARSELVAALAPDIVLDRFNELAYGESGSYNPDAPAFREYLFPFEEQVIERFFPTPPARVLIGGAGGGREAFALARMGYEVTAFEPSLPLVEAMLARAPEGARIAAYRAAYQELPRLAAVREGESDTSLDELGPFDAAIVGWGSFSHLRAEQHRAATLAAFARATAGPILVSFLGLKQNGASSRLARFRQRLPRRPGREVGDVFSVYIGFFHPTSRAETERLAEQAGLEIVHLNFDERETSWPHVVLQARARARASANS